MNSALSHFTALFSMHIELYVWMPMATGLTPASQASDAQAGDPSQFAVPPSNLPVTSANDETRRKWIPKRHCILTVAVAIRRQREAYLQPPASISSAWEKGRRPETELETTCPDRSLYSVLTFTDPQQEHNVWWLQMSPLAARGHMRQRKGPNKEEIGSNFWKVYPPTFDVPVSQGKSQNADWRTESKVCNRSDRTLNQLSALTLAACQCLRFVLTVWKNILMTGCMSIGLLV